MRIKHIVDFVGTHFLGLTTTYFSISALLALTIFLRLLILPVELIKYANAI